jgi:polyphosphate kinase 2 (PPK2 family)
MLEKIDLSKKLSKPEYKAVIGDLETKMGILQREARALGVPVAIVFEGWDASGKGTMINRLLLALDPRGFNVYPTNPPNEEERYRPFLWRFWIKTPARGRFAIFDRSWYGRVMVERIEKLVRKKVWQRAYDEINAFERQLTDDGAVVVKFWLHISKSTQKKRFKKLQKDPATEWKVTRDDWRHHKQYDKYLLAVDEMIERTSPPHAPWTVVEAHDQRYATVKIFKTVIRAIETRLAVTKKKARAGVKAQKKKTEIPIESVLDRVDLSQAVERGEYDKRIKILQKRVWEVEHRIYTERVPLVILFEGWDAAGKGGNIKRLVGNMDPRGYEVIPIAAPNDLEKSHHYLWRFWQHMPKAGHIAIFDRTWYGRVLVERVEGFCSEADWRRAYAEINEMEAYLADFGAVIVKFWLEISKDEQLKRFRARQGTPIKQWKITDEDWRNREKWPQYRAAVDEMLVRTSTTHAPWTIVEANNKLFARIKTLETVLEAVERKLGD